MVDPEHIQFGQIVPPSIEDETRPTGTKRDQEISARFRRTFKALLYVLPQEEFIDLVQCEVQKSFHVKSSEEDVVG